MTIIIKGSQEDGDKVINSGKQGDSSAWSRHYFKEGNFLFEDKYSFQNTGSMLRILLFVHWR